MYTAEDEPRTRVHGVQIASGSQEVRSCAVLAAPLTPSLSSCTQVQDPKLHFCPGTVNARAANATDFFSPAQNGACASIVSFLPTHELRVKTKTRQLIARNTLCCPPPSSWKGHAMHGLTLLRTSALATCVAGPTLAKRVRGYG